MNSASGAAQQANDSKVLQGLARAGFAVSGLLHLIVGGLVVKIALSSSDSGPLTPPVLSVRSPRRPVARSSSGSPSSPSRRSRCGR